MLEMPSFVWLKLKDRMPCWRVWQNAIRLLRWKWKSNNNR
jgi:hypothetical protein